jgi:predicted AlkP superfamily phosphohydrolase/phosphomutase
MSRVVCLGLDGVPCSLLRRLIAEGVMPEMGKLVAQGDLTAMETVYPPLSSVSWTTFFTGVNPGRHRIFGFFESQIDAYGIWFQNFSDVKTPALWDFTQAHGKRTISINLPGTYPAPPFNGVMVSGFIAQEMAKSVYPKMLLPLIEKIGYLLDVPCDSPTEKPVQFWEGVHRSLNARAQTIAALLEHEPFDLFIGVLTETDRVHHYFFDALEESSHPQREAAYQFYRRIDQIVGHWVRLLRPDDELVMLADHGFCRIEQEIFLNHWLKEHGYLVMKTEQPSAPLSEIDPSRTKAFALDPGRIFLNVRGRQADGCVDPKDVPKVREEIAMGLRELTLKVPWSKIPVAPITHVFRREEVYDGPWAHLAADLVLHSANGFDMKGKFNHPALSQMGNLTGMHTFEDAMLYVRDRKRGNGG